MRSIKTTLLTIAGLVLAVASAPSFGLIITDIQNPYKFLQEGDSHTVTHDLTDNGVPNEYKVNRARLRLGFSDGYFWGDWDWDLAQISGDGISGTFEVDGTHVWGYDIRWLRVGTDGIDSLNEDGLLAVTITALSDSWNNYNDFWWKTSKLIAKVEPTAVSEPGILGIFGLGLVGLITIRRKRHPM